MIIPFKDVLEMTAKQAGHTSWNAAIGRLDSKEIFKLWGKAAITLSTRGFHVGWEGRAKLVSHPKKYVEERKAKELSYIKQKLEV